MNVLWNRAQVYVARRVAKRTMWLRTNRGVVVECFKHLTLNEKVMGSIPYTALMSFGKALIYISHSIPRREMET